MVDEKSVIHPTYWSAKARKDAKLPRGNDALAAMRAILRSSGASAAKAYVGWITLFRSTGWRSTNSWGGDSPSGITVDEKSVIHPTTQPLTIASNSFAAAALHVGASLLAIMAFAEKRIASKLAPTEQAGAVLSFGIPRGLSAAHDRLQLLRRRTQARHEAEELRHGATDHRRMSEQAGAQLATAVAHRHGAGDHAVDELL